MLGQTLKQSLAEAGLSTREAEVAEIVATGLSNKEVADRLFVTEKTIKFHLTNIYKKMTMRSRTQLIVWCLPHLRFAGPAEPTPIRSAQPTPETKAAPLANNSSNILELAVGRIDFNRGGNDRAV